MHIHVNSFFATWSELCIHIFVYKSTYTYKYISVHIWVSFLVLLRECNDFPVVCAHDQKYRMPFIYLNEATILLKFSSYTHEHTLYVFIIRNLCCFCCRVIWHWHAHIFVLFCLSHHHHSACSCVLVVKLQNQENKSYLQNRILMK